MTASVKFTPSQKNSNYIGRGANNVLENFRRQFITYTNSLPLIVQYFIQCPRHRIRCDIFVVQPYPYAGRDYSGQV
jgi:hypothetical protein